MNANTERIAQNLSDVRRRMAVACQKSNRTIQSVKLVAVTKTVDIEAAKALNSFGINDFGENRVPELVRKAIALTDTPAVWHMVGHLQRNKVKDLLPHSRIVHSVESADLVDVLNRRADALGLAVDVLIEVNIGGEASKYGVQPAGAEALAKKVASLPALRLRGLMTMAPIADDPETVRPIFSQLRELAATLSRNLPPGAMNELSMGMTQDFEAAIEEGATMVRIGSALFG